MIDLRVAVRNLSRLEPQLSRPLYQHAQAKRIPDLILASCQIIVF